MAESCESGNGAGQAFQHALDNALAQAEADFGVAQAWMQASGGNFAGLGALAAFYAEFAFGVAGAISWPTLVAGGSLLFALYEVADSGATLHDLQADLECAERALPPVQAPDFTCNPFGMCIPQPTNFPVRIDPSGTVVNTKGAPVQGATVTLLQSGNPLGPFTAPPSGSAVMSPSVNPEISTTNGGFDWNVFAGYYEITASKTGCAAPGHPSQATVSTPVFQVPPPRVGIVLTLECLGGAAPRKPRITGLSDKLGAAVGGTRVDISGAGFTSTATVRFGNARAKVVNVLSPTTIVATSPVGHGTVKVSVHTASGTSAVSAADHFTYVTAPKVTRISPDKGLAKGSTRVIITGSGFVAGDEVAFGPVPAHSATVVSASKIIAVAPPGQGTVHVTVTSIGGVSTQVVKYAYSPRRSRGATPAARSSTCAAVRTRPHAASPGPPRFSSFTDVDKGLVSGIKHATWRQSAV